MDVMTLVINYEMFDVFGIKTKVLKLYQLYNGYLEYLTMSIDTVSPHPRIMSPFSDTSHAGTRQSNSCLTNVV